MSSVEKPSLPLSPELERHEALAQVKAFQEIGSGFRELIRAVYVEPTARNLEKIERIKPKIAKLCEPISMEGFFKETKDEVLVTKTVDAVIAETVDNYKLAEAVGDGIGTFELDLPDELREAIIAKLLDDEMTEGEVPEDNFDLTPELIGALPTVIVTDILRAKHEESVEDLYKALLISDTVMEERTHEADKRRKRTVYITAVAAGATSLLGAYLGNVLYERRRK